MNKLGKIHLAFIRGDYAIGKDSGLIDLVLVGDKLNMEEVERVKRKTEKLIRRKIAILILTIKEYDKLQNSLQKKPVFTLFNGNK